MKSNPLWWLPFGQIQEISPSELNSWIIHRRQLQLIDARTQLEFNQGTIGAAMFAPLSETPASVKRLQLDPSQPVIVLCLSGHRSRPGARWLRASGYEAYSLQGRIMAWKRAGFELRYPNGNTVEQNAP